MANKHLTTNSVITERRERDIRASRIQRERERTELRKLHALQRKFDIRSGRAVN